MEPTQSSTIIEDLKDERVPSALYWTIDQVAEWIEELGFPYYKPCFTTNFIDGRRLIRIEASALPKIGITDFEHIKIIAKSIRDLLTLEEPNWTRSISLPPRSDLGNKQPFLVLPESPCLLIINCSDHGRCMYLEKKSSRGKTIDSTTFQQFLNANPDPKWRPPLANMCLIMSRR